MAFKNCALEDDELREYTLTLWPRSGEKYTPSGGTIDRENDIRLFNYGNGSYREESDCYQFIFDFKGIVLNIDIRIEIKGDNEYYYLNKIEGDCPVNKKKIKQALREALKVYGNRIALLLGEDESDKIIMKF